MTDKKHILITGGAGYIGSATVLAFLNKGYEVTVFDNLFHGQRDKVDERATFFKGDLRNKADLEEVFSSSKFDAVVHFAALKAVEESETKPSEYFENNVFGTIQLVSAMERHNVPQIVFSSTAAVYKPVVDAFTEDAELGSVNVYGNTKILAERVIQEFERTGKIQQYALLRYFNVAGDAGLNFKEENAQNVFPILCSAAKENKTFNIFGTDYDTHDGTCVRDYIHLTDMVEAHVAALESKLSGVWNLGTQQGTSVQELVHAFEEVSNAKIEIIKANRRAGDPATVLANASKANKELQWSPKKNLKEMVESSLKAYEE